MAPLSGAPKVHKPFDRSNTSRPASIPVFKGDATLKAELRAALMEFSAA